MDYRKHINGLKMRWVKKVQIWVNLLNLKIGYKVTRHANCGFSQTSKNEFSNLTYLNSGKYL